MLQGALGEIPFEQAQVSVQVYTIKERHARANIGKLSTSKTISSRLGMP